MSLGPDFHGRHPGGFEGAGAVLFPVFGTAKDVVNQAALAALNLLYGRVRVPVTKVRELVDRRVHY